MICPHCLGYTYPVLPISDSTVLPRNWHYFDDKYQCVLCSRIYILEDGELISSLREVEEGEIFGKPNRRVYEKET
jgi:hypothetical protein